MQEENWCSAVPSYDQFSSVLADFDQYSSDSLSALQPKLMDAIHRFCAISSRPNVLLVNALDNSIYRSLIKDWISNVAIRRAEALHSTDQIVFMSETISERALFGCVHAISENGKATSQVEYGLLHKAHGGYLVLSVTAILANPQSWPKLKSVLLGQPLHWQPSDSKAAITLPEPVPLDIKLVIVGDRALLGELDNLEPDLNSGMSLFGEFELEFLLSDTLLPAYIRFIKGLLEENNLPPLADKDALEALLVAGAREYEDQLRAPLCPIWHQNILAESAFEAKNSAITSQHIHAAMQAKSFRESYLPLRAVEDILEGQVVIQCEGEQVGQVNGLTVIEVPGHPRPYGEPARISCVIHFGDGDISDVERKAELGGNLHAKGMMIMQAFVSSSLKLNEPLPYSASIVFEQSYCEVDGDSASLAELCSLVSALSEQPINQQIAITGAVDQFGRVQAVGGINEKVEGFFHICAHRGLTGKQGVILPKTNLRNLVLADDVVDAIKAKQFHIWSVESVDEAIPLLTGKAFRGESEEDTILNRIAQRIEEFEHHEHENPNLLSRLKNWFVQN